MEKQKDLYFQAVRGICMCAVVVIHCQAEGHSVAMEYCQIVLRQIINFAVAVFVFLAGYFAQAYKGGGGVFCRLKKLLIPYVFWTIFYTLLHQYGNINPIRIIPNILTGRASAQLYYIIVIVELTLLTPLLRRSLENRVMSVIALTITPIYLLVCSLIRYSTGTELVWIGRDFGAWIIFYYTGMLIRRYGWKYRNNLRIWIVYAAALLLSISEGFIVNSGLHMFSIAIGQINLTTMLYSLTVIFIIMNNHYANISSSGKGIINRLIYIGNDSYGIYYCHTFVITCISFVMKRMGLMSVLPLPLLQLIQFITVIAGSEIGIWIIRRMDSQNRFCKYIGF